MLKLGFGLLSSVSSHIVQLLHAAQVRFLHLPTQLDQGNETSSVSEKE